MKSLLPFIRMLLAHRAWVLSGLALGLLTLLAAIGLLTLSGWFISAAALAGVSAKTAGQFNYFTPGAGVRGFAIVRTVGRYFERITTHEATFRMLAYLRGWFYRHLEALGPARLQTYRSGDLLNRLVADINALDNLYLRVLVPTLVGALVGVLVVSFIAFYSFAIASVAGVALLLAGVLLPILAGQVASRIGRQQVLLLSELRTRLLALVQGQADLHIYGGVDDAIGGVCEVEARLQATQLRMALISGVTGAMLVVMGGVAGIVTLVLGIEGVRSGDIAPAQLAMLLFCVLAVFEAVAPLPVAYQYLSKTAAAAARLVDITGQSADIHFVEEGVEPTLPGRIELERVSLSYVAGAAPAIEDLSITIEAGEHVLILGHTGSGKSSLISLLVRFHEAQSGDVRLSGRPIAEYDEATLRAQSSVLPQPVQLFAGSVADNLRLADENLTEVAMLDALSRVELDTELGDDPLAWEVGESGSRLSGGQRKRLGLARAMLKPAPVMLLDEPTEGLDAAMEVRVMTGLLKSAGGQTLMMISHHLQMADHFDRIFILDHGRLLEQGAPAELAARPGSRFNQLLAL